jgi:hypothetical protein
VTLRTPGSGRTGYVLRFQVHSEFLRNFPIRTVGSAVHQEYWIPGAQLDAFNDHIEGIIEPIATEQLSPKPKAGP